jgi:D-sedoheptulose 7-phosphate isomerase
MEDKIIQILQEGIEVNRRLKRLAPEIARAARTIIDCIKEGGKVLVCGNGGSAADSQHIAAELVGRFQRERRALPVLALTTDTSILTSLANDYSFESVFARQIQAHGTPGDVLIVISTSGNSPNVIRAAAEAKARGLTVIALLGREGGELAGECEICLIVPAADTARIQEGQSAVYHILCDLVEEAFCENDET